MNGSLKKFGWVYLAVVMACGAAFAEGGGTSIGGGGEWVDVNGRPSLRDLVDNTVCRWQSADQFGKERPHFARILSNIGAVHPHFEAAIRSELLRINVCRTKGDLKRVATEDLDSVTIYSYQKTHQLAVRLNKAIYVDERTLKRMPEAMQAYVLLHETLHSFIPMATDRRNNKLRSMVATISDMETAPISSGEFAVNLEMNSVAIAPVARDLDRYQASLVVALDESRPLVERYAAARDLEGGMSLISLPDRAAIGELIEASQDEYVVAVQSNDAARVASFLKAGVDQNSRVVEGKGTWCPYTALRYVIGRGYRATAQVLLADPRTVVKDTYLSSCGEESSLLKVAASRRDAALVRMLLSRKDYLPVERFREDDPLYQAPEKLAYGSFF